MANRGAARSSEPHWVIRTKDLFLSRPMPQSALVKKIESGDLNPLDEVCAGNGYWFGLHEVEEVRKHLGDIDLTNLSKGVEIEITSSTETNTIKKTMILEVPKAWAVSPPEQKTFYSTETAEPAPAQKTVKKSRAPEPALERQWGPAIAFGALFTIVLIGLWLNSG